MGFFQADHLPEGKKLGDPNQQWIGLSKGRIVPEPASGQTVLVGNLVVSPHGYIVFREVRQSRGIEDSCVFVSDKPSVGHRIKSKVRCDLGVDSHGPSRVHERAPRARNANRAQRAPDMNLSITRCRRKHGIGKTDTLVLTDTFVSGEDECLIFPDWAPTGRPELIAMEGWQGRVKVVSRIQRLVAEEPESISVKRVGAGLRNGGYNRAGGASILGRVVAG